VGEESRDRKERERERERQIRKTAMKEVRINLNL
jgi:hypothetical protein